MKLWVGLKLDIVPVPIAINEYGKLGQKETINPPWQAGFHSWFTTKEAHANEKERHRSAAVTPCVRINNPCCIRHCL
jgi:hypothetical protein